jgi:hypothetical protein
MTYRVASDVGDDLTFADVRDALREAARLANGEPVFLHSEFCRFEVLDQDCPCDPLLVSVDGVYE